MLELSSGKACNSAAFPYALQSGRTKIKVKAAAKG